MRRQKELQAADPTMDDLSSIVDAFEAPIDEAGRIEAFLAKTPIADEANADLAPKDILAAAADSSSDAASGLVSLDVDESALAEMDAVVESPKEIRPAASTSIEMPSVRQQQRTYETPISKTALTELQFPIDSEIKFQIIDDERQRYGIYDRKKNVGLAAIDLESSRFLWQQGASAVDFNRLVHGRLLNRSGDAIYLRPSIEADALSINLRSASQSPTWDLGASLLRSVTEVEMNWIVPKTVDLAWEMPFQMKRDRGYAVAFVEPTDGETVAIGVKFFVKLSRKLQVKTELYARLDQDLPWWPIDRRRL
ncbi:MAG: hypothetical protein AAF802_33445, partial [Planctomycetota bacterium]